MLQVGGYFIVLVCFFIGLAMAYINQAAKSVYTYNNSYPDIYATRAAQAEIMDRINSHIEYLEQTQGTLPPQAYSDQEQLYYTPASSINSEYYPRAQTMPKQMVGEEMLLINV